MAFPTYFMYNNHNTFFSYCSVGTVQVIYLVKLLVYGNE